MELAFVLGHRPFTCSLDKYRRHVTSDLTFSLKFSWFCCLGSWHCLMSSVMPSYFLGQGGPPSCLQWTCNSPDSLHHLSDGSNCFFYPRPDHLRFPNCVQLLFVAERNLGVGSTCSTQTCIWWLQRSIWLNWLSMLARSMHPRWSSWDSTNTI